FDLGLGITWVPDWFGAQRSALAAADASWQSSQATARSTEIALGASLSLSYISLRSAQARLALAQANLASQQETMQITDWRRQAGLVTDLEAAQARSAAAQTESLLPALQTQIDQSSHALATASGDAPDHWLSALAPMARLPDNASTAPTSVAVDTLRQRPDVQATEALFRAARATLDQTEAERLPSLSLSATLGLSAIRLGSLLHNAALLSKALLGLSVPLLDGGAGAARVAAQQAVVAQARNAWISSVLTALREVDDALVAQRNDQLALAALVQAATAAAEADRLAGLRYRSGLVDFQTVLDTQRSRLSTEDGVALARATLQADRIRLVQALGGGWTTDLPDLPDPVWAHLDAATD
ncbi:TolC family protein, partial [Ideonella sp.]|uniref:TolC family protein n=1 Tax=Ideonella sp. TaxID=1929293 RepID=UPI003BB7C6F3